MRQIVRRSVRTSRVLLVLLILTSGGATSAAAQVVATGQTTCWDSGGTAAACVGSGQDGALQEGIPRSYTDNLDGTITDHATGLVWEKLTNPGHEDLSDPHNVNNVYSWADAFRVKISALNTEPCLAQHCDWRLPNINELLTLVDFERTHPAIDPIFNSGDSFTLAASTYWSSTTSLLSLTSGTDPSQAWTVYSDTGFIRPLCKACGAAVRAVRGGGDRSQNEDPFVAAGGYDTDIVLKAEQTVNGQKVPIAGFKFTEYYQPAGSSQWVKTTYTTGADGKVKYSTRFKVGDYVKWRTPHGGSSFYVGQTITKPIPTKMDVIYNGDNGGILELKDK